MMIHYNSQSGLMKLESNHLILKLELCFPNFSYAHSNEQYISSVNVENSLLHLLHKRKPISL